MRLHWTLTMLAGLGLSNDDLVGIGDAVASPRQPAEAHGQRRSPSLLAPRVGGRDHTPITSNENLPQSPPMPSACIQDLPGFAEVKPCGFKERSEEVK